MHTKDLANAMIFAFLNSIEAHNEAEPMDAEGAVLVLVRELADYMDGTDLGDRLREVVGGLNATDNNALDPADIAVALNGPRSPYNITSAIRSLTVELRDLDGVQGAVAALYDARQDAEHAERAVQARIAQASA